VLCRWGVWQDNLVLSTGLIIWIVHRKEIRISLRWPILIHIINPVDKTKLPIRLRWRTQFSRAPLLCTGSSSDSIFIRTSQSAYKIYMNYSRGVREEHFSLFVSIILSFATRFATSEEYDWNAWPLCSLSSVLLGLTKQTLET